MHVLLPQLTLFHKHVLASVYQILNVTSSRNILCLLSTKL